MTGEGTRGQGMRFLPSPPALSRTVLFRLRFSSRAAVSLTLRNTENRQLRKLSKRLCSRVVSNAKRKQICAK